MDWNALIFALSMFSTQYLMARRLTGTWVIEKMSFEMCPLTYPIVLFFFIKSFTIKTNG